MPRVSFTSHLERFADSRPVEVPGETVRDALDNALADNPTLRGYVLDDQSLLRRHVVVFLDGKTVVDLAGLTDPVRPDSEIYVMQALSGG